ncbi:winged helix-turn-helix transcriptional regulator [Frisingicoccus sp.]|uniref:winged helix-turn-helix transcriptional regulator n=1 Tax=Frisingicoccus sp. TaxID=1918627 RepID=UPI003AB6E508
MRIKIPIHPMFLEENEKEEMATEINFNQNERSLSEVLSEVLSKKDFDKVKKIVSFIEQHGAITPKDAMKICKKSSATVRRYLKILTETGYIISVGNTNNTLYKRK